MKKFRAWLAELSDCFQGEWVQSGVSSARCVLGVQLVVLRPQSVVVGKPAPDLGGGGGFSTNQT